MTLTEKALQLALTAHAGQTRKSDGTPYIAHPVMVAFSLQSYGFDESVIAAALVHDVLEDTDVPRQALADVLGEEVVQIVEGVSEDTSLQWEVRKEKYVARVATASVATKAVSIADKIHNAESVIAYHATKGKEAWAVFNRGKEKKLWFENMLYTEVSKTWEHPMLERYKELITIMEDLEA